MTPANPTELPCSGVVAEPAGGGGKARTQQ